MKKALGLYRRYLELNPGNPVATHMVSALGDGPKPTRASDAYVESLFDRFAEDFDRKLLEELKYRGPELLLEAVTGVLPRSPPRLDILDLGCGTGLAGLQFRPLARRLEGVDLSPKMVARARARDIHDAVWVGELTTAMEAMNGKFDLLIAADVFPYIGDLAPVFAAAAGALRPGGLLAFIVEWRRRPGYRLTGSGRYAHNPAYVRKSAKAAGFGEVSGSLAQFRLEFGKPVKGYVSVMRKV
jgi:predicted TPR repeat methyltransferase